MTLLSDNDPKNLSDDELMKKVQKCREYLNFGSVNNNYGMLQNLSDQLFIFEEELNFRNQKKYISDELEAKRKENNETKYPINIGTVEGEARYGKKD